ncbi:MAG: bifunctional UDP-3-O-[3-hydroxymyristoyl] N-acetylglucosamine deacetylase/3-hydroxyacyl-ACP dehydratase [Candidatus Coatesbacteria bacterium]|nr:bifunctional UDP-3-O-[3-hydroxymyristoyl] N-acetylglucosamine deacetylase/3-hydroxyacyl-ACP dehydratase [Candidatus Coatesbacteria bacterium]
MHQKQKTFGKAISYTGIGLHYGKQVTIRFAPAPVDTGVVFCRKDLPDKPLIKADVENVLPVEDISRRTTLGKGEARIHTVEHILATLNGLSIDNAFIEIDGDEPPEPEDGSCRKYVNLFKEAGIVEQDALRNYHVLKEPVSYSENGVTLLAIPYDGLRISFTIHYNHPLVGTQYGSFVIDEKTFINEVSEARTFCFEEDVKTLQEQGLVKGGSLNNAVVIGKESILNVGGLRFPDEFVRHKILDLIGDIYLLGKPLKAHIISNKSGHLSNIEFVRQIKTQIKPDTTSINWGIDKIMRLLPHRYPFLLVDRILEVQGDKRIVGLKNVTINEPFFQGHFPNHPIMPGVLLVEAMGQVGGVLLLNLAPVPEDYVVYFMGLDKVKFRRPVRPGDQIKFVVEVKKIKGPVCVFEGKAYVEGQLACEAELMAISKPKEDK